MTTDSDFVAEITSPVGVITGVCLGACIVSVVVGFLMGLLFMNVYIHHKNSSKKAVHSQVEEQAREVPTDAVIVSPVYEEVSQAPQEQIELRSNQAYGPI